MDCPRCGEGSDLDFSSSREMETSIVNCPDCGFGFQAPVDEDCLIEMVKTIKQESCADYEKYI
jgi:hypothetical protein